MKRHSLAICRSLAGAALAIAALAIAALSSPALATDLAVMSEAERAAFRAEVRAYLIENPEVLLEAINTLEARQAADQVTADAAMVSSNAAAIFADGRSWVGGNPDGDITLVEFVDYRCGYCKKAHAEVAELIQSDGNIRYVLKEFPILGEQSVLASRFAIAVRAVGGADIYWQMHDALMTLRGDVSPETLDRLATELGLDPAAVRTAMTNPEVDAEIAANHALGDALQISGTPTFVLQDKLLRAPDSMLRGYVPLATMQELVGDLRG